ncbi:MAG: DNA repair protein RecO [Bacteroidota bacterium]
MIVRTDAVVLRAIEYGETSLIVTLFTRRHGQVTVMAKGARRPKSRFGSALQPMGYVQVVYYYKPGRGLQTLKESAHVQVLHGVAADIEKITVGLRLVELVRALTEDQEENPLLFTLLVQALLELDGAAERAANVLPHFQLRMATVLGFAPDVQRGDVLALPDEGGVLALDTGAVLPLAAAPKAGARVGRQALRAFAVFARADLATAMRMALSADLRDEVQRLVDAYLRYHVEEAYPDRVRKVAGQLTPPPSAPPA